MRQGRSASWRGRAPRTRGATEAEDVVAAAIAAAAGAELAASVVQATGYPAPRGGWCFSQGRSPAAVALALVLFMDVQRDVLPLPEGPLLSSLLRGGGPSLGSQSRARRLRRARGQEEWLHRGVRALNALGGRGEPAPRVGSMSLAQRQSVKHLAQVYGSVPPPPPHHDPSPQRAFEVLLGTRCGYNEVAEGRSSSYQRGCVSLPREQSGGVDLVEALPPDL